MWLAVVGVVWLALSLWWWRRSRHFLNPPPPPGARNVAHLTRDLHPYLTMPASHLAVLLRDRKVTSPELTELFIAQIERVDPLLNAVVVKRFAEARAEAAAAQRRLDETSDPLTLPPFLGVPCTVKECFLFKGQPSASGLWSRRLFRGESDATSIGRMRAAGMIILGQTNTPELCMWYESENQVYGLTNNAYDRSRTVGGSSGGEACIISAAGSTWGLGSDVGGSIRMPAFFNGIFGHKPTGGVVPNTGQHPASTGRIERYCATGPLCRYASDLWPLLNVLAGPDGTSPQWHLEQPWLATGASPASVDVRKLRVLNVRLPKPKLAYPLDPELIAAQDRVVAHLRSLGCAVEEVHYPEFRNSMDMWSSALALEDGPSFRERMRDGQPVRLLWEFIKMWFCGQHVSKFTFPGVVLALIEPFPKLFMGRTRAWEKRCSAFAAKLNRDLGSDAIMLYPSHAVPAPPHRWSLLRPLNFAYTAIFNTLELPVTQVPLGLCPKRRIPLGVQVVGGLGQDHVTIAVAQELERAFGGWTPPQPL